MRLFANFNIDESEVSNRNPRALAAMELLQCLFNGGTYSSHLLGGQPNRDTSEAYENNSSSCNP